MAGWRETKTLKPIDEAIGRMVSESPGRNASEREMTPKRPILGGRAVDDSVKATRAVAVWLTRRAAPTVLGAAKNRRGLGWKRWSTAWLYDTLGLFADYRMRYVARPESAPSR